MDLKLPGHKPDLAPGMTQVVEAGERYVITDNEGKELELVGRDDPLVIEFLHAFDSWFAVRKALGAENETAERAWQVVMEKWQTLPNRLVLDFPTIKAGGISVPGRANLDIRVPDA